MGEICCIDVENAVVIPDVFRDMFKNDVKIYLEEDSIVFSPL